MVEKNERKSADSNELADYLTTKRIEFSYSTGKLGKYELLRQRSLEIGENIIAVQNDLRIKIAHCAKKPHIVGEQLECTQVHVMRQRQIWRTHPVLNMDSSDTH